jgi:hypothetical protein
MKRLVAGLFAAALALPLLSGPAAAQGRDHDRDRGREHERREHRAEGWHGDIHRFHERDFDRWRGGHWYHGMHDGRLGWWWTVGPSWYFYNEPIYPYPDPYVPPVAVAPPAPGPQQYWYYCRNPQGYYPYVPQCYGNWEPVPAG